MDYVVFFIYLEMKTGSPGFRKKRGRVGRKGGKTVKIQRQLKCPILCPCGYTLTHCSISGKPGGLLMLPEGKSCLIPRHQGYH